MNTRQLFEICQGSVPLDVMNVHGSAGDNAADTLGSRFVRGDFTDEFISIWYGTLQGILCDDDTSMCTEEARAWFVSHGVTY